MKPVNFNYKSNLNVADSLVIYSTMIHFILLNINFLQCEGLSSLSSTKRSKIFMLTTETSETSENITTTTELSTTTQNTNDTKDEWNNYDERCLWKPAVILPATTKHLSTVIFLHGVGESADHWAQILEYSRQPSMKVICPNENLTQIKNIQRNQMDTTHFNIGPINTENEECLNKSTKHIHSLITDEIKSGIKPENIIVGGFSQGGAIAIQSVFTYPKKLGGVIAMSTWIPMPHLFFRDFILSNTDIPIFHGYGNLDHMVPYHVSNFTALCFNKMSMNTVSKIYHGVKHEVPMEGIADIEDFLNKVKLKLN